MQPITKFFSPKKDTDTSEFQDPNSETSKKSCSKKKSNLLKVIDHEVEDIVGILSAGNADNTPDVVDLSSDNEHDETAHTNGSLENGKDLPEPVQENGEQTTNEFTPKKKIDSGDDISGGWRNKESKVYQRHTVSNTLQNSPETPQSIEIVTSPKTTPLRSRRFSFNIRSPNRIPQSMKSNLSTSPDSLFDEARGISATNSWDKKKDCEVEIIHPKKRFKCTSSTSDADDGTVSPLAKLVARKLVIPCLQPPSAFPNPPKEKEFYNLRQSINDSRQKNYVLMSAKNAKKNAAPVYYEIERIVTHKINNKVQSEKKFQFLVKWAGFSDKYTSWEPEDHFHLSPIILLNYTTKLHDTVTRKSTISDDLIDLRKKLNRLNLKISAKNSQVYLWQLDTELSSQAFKQQYRRLLRQYASKVKEELGPSFPSVEIQNTVDFNLPPLNFTFVRDRFAGKGVHISDDTLIGCVCSGEYGVRDCCLVPGVQCCPHLGDADPPYNNKGRLLLKQGAPIYECNARCSCPPDCGNRIVQRGTQVTTAIYKTPDKGWGLKTQQDIPKGTFVVEYVGEVITFEEAEQRGKEYDAQGLTYLFDLDYQTSEGLEVDEGMFTIDAAFYGNTSHFINHSCDPNLAVFSCWISNLDIRLPHICLYAIKNITAGQELTFNYQIDRIEDDSRAAQRLSVECRCGTKKCVRYLHG